MDDDTYDGADDSGERYMVGHGATEAEAIEDLQRLFEERDEYLEDLALLQTYDEAPSMITAVYDNGILMGWRAIAAEVGEVFIPRRAEDIQSDRVVARFLWPQKRVTNDYSSRLPQARPRPCTDIRSRAIENMELFDQAYDPKINAGLPEHRPQPNARPFLIPSHARNRAGALATAIARAGD